MKFCSFQYSNTTSFGVLDRGFLYDLSGVDGGTAKDLNNLYAKANRDIAKMVEMASGAMQHAKKIPFDYKLLRLPVKPTEVWGAGVTYLRSRQARESETKTKGLYDYVYDATRPELFLKDSGLRCRGPNEEIGVRSDSTWTVPEPELTVVCDSEAKVVGFTIGNDVSSRDIEGENPLYLPQAKVYSGSASIGPIIVTPDEVGDPRSLEIKMRIRRGGKDIFQGSTNTSQLKRSVPELLKYLKRDNELSTFTLLMTGTSIVPPDDFTLQSGDEVQIEIARIGMLVNPVRKLSGS
jgi:2-dehydro-3-deoxy-D-arabinonate dehydratase